MLNAKVFSNSSFKYECTVCGNWNSSIGDNVSEHVPNLCFAPMIKEVTKLRRIQNLTKYLAT